MSHVEAYSSYFRAIKGGLTVAKDHLDAAKDAVARGDPREAESRSGELINTLAAVHLNVQQLFQLLFAENARRAAEEAAKP